MLATTVKSLSRRVGTATVVEAASIVRAAVSFTADVGKSAWWFVPDSSRCIDTWVYSEKYHIAADSDGLTAIRCAGRS